MGIHALPLTLLLAVQPQPQTQAQAQAQVQSQTQPLPMGEVAYQMALLEGGIPELQLACADAARFNLKSRLQELRDRLMLVAPAPQPFPVVMANARALLTCKAPATAQVVLNRFGPGPGQQRRQWLLLDWRAASASLDHRRAALALRRLANGELASLDLEQLVVGVSEDGQPLTRTALDLLADHEAASGQLDRAAAVLLAGRTQGAVAARRYGLVAEWLQTLGQPSSDALLEAALDQAAADQAWSTAVELLRLQLRLNLQAGGDGSRARQRLERLSRRLDDRYTLLQRSDADPDALDQQLRSPRQPGGHAALGESRPAGSPVIAPSPSP